MNNITFNDVFLPTTPTKVRKYQNKPHFVSIDKLNLNKNLSQYLHHNLQYEHRFLFNSELANVKVDIVTQPFVGKQKKIIYTHSLAHDAPFYMHVDKVMLYKQFLYKVDDDRILSNIFLSNLYINFCNQSKKDKIILLKNTKENLYFKHPMNEFRFILDQLLKISYLSNNIDTVFSNVTNLYHNLDYVCDILNTDIHYYLSIIKTLAIKRKEDKVENKSVIFYLCLFLYIHLLTKEYKDFEKELFYDTSKFHFFLNCFFVFENTKEFYKLFLPFINNLLSKLLKQDNDRYNFFDEIKKTSFFIDPKTQNNGLQVYNVMKECEPLLLCFCEYEAKHNIYLINEKKEFLFIKDINSLFVKRDSTKLLQYINLIQFYRDDSTIIPKTLRMMDDLVTKDDGFYCLGLKGTLLNQRLTLINMSSFLESNCLFAPILHNQHNKNPTLFAIKKFSTALIHFDRKDVVLTKEHFENSLLISLMFYILPINKENKNLFTEDLFIKLFEIMNIKENIDTLYKVYSTQYFDLFVNAYCYNEIFNKHTKYFYDTILRHIEVYYYTCFYGQDEKDLKDVFCNFLSSFIDIAFAMSDYIVQCFKNNKVDNVFFSAFYQSLIRLCDGFTFYIKDIATLKESKAEIHLKEQLIKYADRLTQYLDIYNQYCQDVSMSFKDQKKFLIKEQENLFDNLVANDFATIDLNAMYIETAEKIQAIEQKEIAKSSIELDFDFIAKTKEETEHVQDVISLIKDENNDKTSITLNGVNDKSSLNIKSNDAEHVVSVANTVAEHATNANDIDAKYASLDPKVHKLLEFVIEKKSEQISLSEFKDKALSLKFLSHYAPIELINDYFYEIKEDKLLDIDAESDTIYVTLALLD